MGLFDKIYEYIFFIIGGLYAYRTFYLFISFFFKSRRYLTKPQSNNYAVLIPARNERFVISGLIDSIKKQTYDKDKMTIFVIADNCDDDTADIARNLGCVVYERFNKLEVSKGYALQFLMKNIENDYGIQHFDGYFILDADNLIATNFIEKMNDAFQECKDVVISYRNTKNFDTNFISASYGIHFYRNTFNSHRPRSILNITTNITGTGFLISSELLKDGWKWTSLTEDAEITMDLTSKNKKILFCEEAQLYDEQPTDIKTAYKQRIRWSKGGLVCFFKIGPKLFLSALKKPSFSKYDMFLHTLPIGLISFILGLAYQIIKSILYYNIYGKVDFLSTLNAYRDFLLIGYVTAFITGSFTLIKERHHIKCKLNKLIWYLLWWPLYDLASLPLNIIVLFKRVKWKPIIHKDTRTISSIED